MRFFLLSFIMLCFSGLVYAIDSTGVTKPLLKSAQKKGYVLTSGSSNFRCGFPNAPACSPILVANRHCLPNYDPSISISLVSTAGREGFSGHTIVVSPAQPAITVAPKDYILYLTSAYVRAAAIFGQPQYLGLTLRYTVYCTSSASWQK